jgi:hypothetical protein
MTDHLSEAAIQQYVLDAENCPAWMAEHVHDCERCRVQLANYRLIFKQVEQMDVPVVSVDVAELLTKLGQGTGVAAQRARVRTRKKDWSIGYWLGGAGLTMMIAGWIFRTFLLTVAGDTPALILYALVGVSVGIAIVRGLGMIIQYRHQINNLDLS